MSVVSNNILAGASGQGGSGYEIERSLRFNPGDSPSLTRTPSSSGNRKTFTISLWAKKSQIGTTYEDLLSCQTNGQFRFIWEPNGNLEAFSKNGSTTTFHIDTVALFRDASAWYHFVLRVDAANTSVKFYANGVELTDLTTHTAVQNLDTIVNTNTLHSIGKDPQGSHFSGYLADYYLIDGQALDCTSFGEFDDNGVWQPKAYSGTYGTNGFHLDFKDNSSNAALGTDTSGNSNTWTVNNLSAGIDLNATAKQNFDVVTYSGNGGTQSIGGLAFQPDLVWIKQRDSTRWHSICDSVRGPTKLIYPNDSNAEATEATALQSFNSDGFTLGNTSKVNNYASPFVAWAWKAGGAASSNTDGTITSSVSANASYGFSIAKYTGTGASASFGHGLSNAPKVVIVKKLTAASWNFYHSEVGATKTLELNSTAAEATAASWDSTTPTNSVVSVGNYPDTNDSGGDYIAYCWSEVAGFSKFGSWNGNSGSTTVTFGFKPRFVLWKSKSATNWHMIDSARGVDQHLYPNGNSAEANQDYYGVDFTDTGITINSSYGDVNASGSTYVYMAFAASTPGDPDNDSLVDTPTNAAEPSDSGIGGEVVGNYCTLNPLDKRDSPTFSNGNLQVNGSGAAHCVGRATFAVSSGKWYWETTINSALVSTYYPSPGICSMDGAVPNQLGDGASGHAYMANGQKYTSATLSSYGASFTNGDILGFALDLDAGTLTAYKNGASQGVLASGLTGSWSPSWNHYQSTSLIYNFGQRAFAYAAPSGYKSLNTANLPEPTIADGSQYFDTKLYTGNGGSQTISGLNFSPDLTWFKKRGGPGIARGHALQDIVRGAGKTLESHSTSAEYSDVNALTSFNSDGFSIGSEDRVNENNGTYAAWAWDAGTSTVSNTDGSITSQVRAQPSAGFSICTNNGNGGIGESVGHGLSAAPEFIICKCRNSGVRWAVYTKTVGPGNTLVLDSTGGPTGGTGVWGNVNPTNSVFTVGNDPEANGSGNTYVAYCFAPVEGYSAMGSFVGNGSTDGPFVYTGFKVSWIMMKRTDTAGYSWFILDATRSPYNDTADYLIANSSGAEADNTTFIDILSNGFKLRDSGATPNGSGGTYVYLAFASNPFASNGGLAR